MEMMELIVLVQDAELFGKQIHNAIKSVTTCYVISMVGIATKLKMERIYLQNYKISLS